MNDTESNLLTNSRMQCFKTCRKKHYFAYERGIRADRSSTPLRIGGNVHKALDLLAQRVRFDEIHAEILDRYAELPTWADTPEAEYAWQMECHTVLCMISGYMWRYGDQVENVIATEQVFELPIVNPETGRPSQTFRISGVIDKIIERDGKLFVREHKTTGDPIEDIAADYWKRLRLDEQCSLYYWAAHQLGYDIEAVEYDVIKKPTISPLMATPPEKRKYKKDGTLYANQREANETGEAWSQRLVEDMGKRPGFYFQRRIVPRTNGDITEYLHELWDTAKTIRHAQLTEAHYRTASACQHPYRCEYLDHCHNGIPLEGGRPA